MKGKSVTPNDMIKELAHALKEVIGETDEGYLEQEPEDAYTDLAARLVFRLSKGALTVAPVVPAETARREAIFRAQGAAAARIFGIFTEWMVGRPERHCISGFDRSGKFEVVMRTGGETRAYFQGVTIQDAYAQAAQTITFQGLTDGEEEQAKVKSRGVEALLPPPKIDVQPVPPKPVDVQFNPSEIAKRLQYVNIEELLQGIFDAIDGAKAMAGSLPPEDCDEDRETLEQLRKTVVFVFGADR